MPQLIKTGKLGKPHGLKGDLVFYSEASFKKGIFIFIEINQTPTPFFVTDIKMAGKNKVISLDTVKTTEAAKALISKELWINEKDLVTEKKHRFENYMLVDKEKNISAPVMDVLQLPSQKMLVIELAGREIMLPYADAFIEKIDTAGKRIYYKAPAGIFDL